MLDLRLAKYSRGDARGVKFMFLRPAGGSHSLDCYLFWWWAPLAEGPGGLPITCPIISSTIWPVFFLSMLLCRFGGELSSSSLSSATEASEADESPADGDSCRRTRVAYSPPANAFSMVKLCTDECMYLEWWHQWCVHEDGADGGQVSDSHKEQGKLVH